MGALRLLLTALFCAAGTLSATVTREGYLADILCVDRVVALDNANMITGPEEHTVHCLLVPVCIASGFTILEKYTGQGTPTAYGQMWNFTSAANTRVVAWLRQFDESKKDVLIVSTGTMVGDKFDATTFQFKSDVVAASSSSMSQQAMSAMMGSSSSSMAMPMMVTREGYLADILCVDRVVAFDGANMITGPEDHSVKCLRLPDCVASGFTILEKYMGQGTPTMYGQMWNFTSAANARVVTWLQQFDESKKNILIIANGTMVGNKFDAMTFQLKMMPVADSSSMAMSTMMGSSSSSMAMPMTVTREGYLADILCVDRVVAFDGANMITGPEDHSVKCLRLPDCVASGFTILEKYMGQGTPTMYGQMWNFTSAANARVVTWLQQFDESKKNILITANGTMVGNKFDAMTFQLKMMPVADSSSMAMSAMMGSSSSSSMAMPMMVTREGYLADILCVDRVVAFDGANMITGPEDHSVKCLRLPDCVASGFTILEKYMGQGTPTMYGQMWNFTSAANARVVTWLQQFDESKKNILITANGTMVGNKFDAMTFQLKMMPVADSSSMAMSAMMGSSSSSMAMPMMVTREGYLADILCVDRVVAFDGANMITGPEDHSVKCLRLPDCVASGFTILEKYMGQGTPTMYGQMWNFTSAANARVVTWLQQFDESKKNILIIANGTMVGNKFDAMTFQLKMMPVADSSSMATSAMMGSSSSSMAMPMMVTREGYLADILCVDRVVAFDGANMITGPEDHSVKCLRLPDCVASGFTILEKYMGQGTPTMYGQMWNFTSAANARVVTWLQQFDESKKNILIIANGTMVGNKFDAMTFQLKMMPVADSSSMAMSTMMGSSSSSSMAMPMMVTREGYLADILCVDRVVAFDGANMITGPEDHSVKCLRLPDCVASGFTILEKYMGQGTPTMYGQMWNFTSAANARVVTWLQQFDESKKNILIIANGTMVGNKFDAMTFQLKMMPVADSSSMAMSTMMGSSSSSSMAMPMMVTREGYLADILCVDRVVAFDGANMITGPEDHSVKCLRLPDCVASGFTILEKYMGQGTPTMYGQMWNFTSAANARVVTWLQQFDESKKNILIIANGTMVGNKFDAMTFQLKNPIHASPPDSGSSEDLSTGAIVGIAIGGAAVVALAVVASVVAIKHLGSSSAARTAAVSDHDEPMLTLPAKEHDIL